MKTLKLLTAATLMILSASAFADEKQGSKTESAQKAIQLPALSELDPEAPIDFLHVAFPAVSIADATEIPAGLTVNFPEIEMPNFAVPLTGITVNFPAVELPDADATIND